MRKSLVPYKPAEHGIAFLPVVIIAALVITGGTLVAGSNGLLHGQGNKYGILRRLESLLPPSVSSALGLQDQDFDNQSGSTQPGVGGSSMFQLNPAGPTDNAVQNRNVNTNNPTTNTNNDNNNGSNGNPGNNNNNNPGVDGNPGNNNPGGNNTNNPGNEGQ